MIGQDSDAAVLRFLRSEGPGTVTVRQLATATGIPRVTVRTAVASLAVDGLLCVIASADESTYMIRHLHAAPGPCEQPLACKIREDPSWGGKGRAPAGIRRGSLARVRYPRMYAKMASASRRESACTRLASSRACLKATFSAETRRSSSRLRSSVSAPDQRTVVHRPTATRIW